MLRGALEFEVKGQQKKWRSKGHGEAGWRRDNEGWLEQRSCTLLINVD